MQIQFKKVKVWTIAKGKVTWKIFWLVIPLLNECWHLSHNVQLSSPIVSEGNCWWFQLCLHLFFPFSGALPFQTVRKRKFKETIVTGDPVSTKAFTDAPSKFIWIVRVGPNIDSWLQSALSTCMVALASAIDSSTSASCSSHHRSPTYCCCWGVLAWLVLVSHKCCHLLQLAHCDPTMDNFTQYASFHDSGNTCLKLCPSVWLLTRSRSITVKKT